MKCSLTICLAASVATFAATAVGDDDKINEYVAQLRDAEHASQRVPLCLSLFAITSPDDLSHLLTVDDASIAVQSAWETVKLTVPEDEGDRTYNPDRRRLNWFLGFLQGRARIKPPDWWRDAVLKSKAYRRDNIFAPRPKSTIYHHSGNNLVNCPKDATVEIDGDTVAYCVTENRITIPEGIFDRHDCGVVRCNLSGCFTDKLFFLALHDEWGYPHDVVCVDRSSGDLVWKSTANGCWYGGVSGQSESWASVIATSDNRVFVFGQAPTGFYVDGFRVSDGKSLFHFSNNY